MKKYNLSEIMKNAMNSWRSSMLHLRPRSNSTAFTIREENCNDHYGSA